MKKSLFNYAVLLHKRNEKNEIVDTIVIVEPKAILAKSEKDVAFKATREVPEDKIDNPEDIEILVSPF
jgi:hypothetical protein